jgi:hypothetical protein
VKEKPNVGSPFFWTFPSYCVPESKKDANVYFYIQSYFTAGITAANSCELYQQFKGMFGSYCGCKRIGKKQRDGQTDGEEEANRCFLWVC